MMHRLIRHVRKEPKLRGFSLVELMVVIVIIGVLTGVALGIFGSRRAERSVRATASELSMLFADLRARAVQTNRAVGVQVQASNGTSSVARIDWYESTSDSCRDINFAAPVDFMELNHRDWSGPTGVATITRVGPTVADNRVVPSGLTRLCFTGSGRVVSASTIQPVEPACNTESGAAGLGGRTYFELRAIICNGGRCNTTEYVITMVLNTDGTMEQLSPGTRVQESGTCT